MKKTLFALFLISFFYSNWGTAQKCTLKELKQERFDEEGNSKELLQYQFFFATDGALEKIQIKDNSTSSRNTEHILKFENVGQGRKITWFWDGEYDTHFILTKDHLFEFANDDGNDMDFENADTYPLTFTNGKLTFDEDGNITYNWEDDLVRQTVREGRKFKTTIDFTYTDVSNPLYGLLELGIIEISVGNFIELLHTLPAKLLATENRNRESGGVEEEYNSADQYAHTIKNGNCPEQFSVVQGRDKLVYTFIY